MAIKGLKRRKVQRARVEGKIRELKLMQGKTLQGIRKDPDKADVKGEAEP